MQDFRQRRRPFLRALVSTLSLALLLFLAAVAGRAAFEMYGRFVRASESSAAAEGKRVELKSRLLRAGEEVEALRGERGVEAALRERYGVARPGEGEIRIVRKMPEAAASEGPNILERIWEMLFVW